MLRSYCYLMQQDDKGGALAEGVYFLHEVYFWESREYLFDCHYHR